MNSHFSIILRRNNAERWNLELERILLGGTVDVLLITQARMDEDLIHVTRSNIIREVSMPKTFIGLRRAEKLLG